MKKLIITLLIVTTSLFVSAQSITYTYHFSKPNVQQIAEYQILEFEKTVSNGTVGEPTLPWQSISLMLPPNSEATTIHVILSDFAEMESPCNLLPTQRPRPISDDSPFTFEKNEALYRSNETYPNKAFNTVSTQVLNGVSFAFGGFTPVKYKPASGQVSYAQTVTVTVEYQASRADHSKKLWLRPETKNTISRLAQNADMLDGYVQRDEALPHYEMLVVTPESYVESFADYVALYAGRGIRVHVVALQEIYAAMTGRDNQEKIRNYIIHEYENHGISMVMLGGDVNLVPYRSLWCFAQEGYEDNIPSDSYYACLDGTLNDNNNDLWGEIGEDDLLPELAVSRFSFNNANELQILLSKTFSYLTSPVLGEFRRPILAGEHLGDGYYASQDLEHLVGEVNFNGYTTYGYPENYDIFRIYTSPTYNWNSDTLARAINKGCQYVHHFGHANTNIVAGWHSLEITPSLFWGANGVNHNYFIFKSQGCVCGDFSDMCILERMVTNQTGAVASIGNSRYGWYSPLGDGASSHYHREFVDAHCHERIAGLGEALRECKIQTSPFITLDVENGVMRWCFYGLNVIGDVGLSAWFDEPFTPNIDCPTVLPVGTTHLPITITDETGQGVYNFECRLFKGSELIGLATTDADGVVELHSAAANNNDTLDLYVTGMNGWPEHLVLTFDNDNCAHVLFDHYSLNDPDGQVDFNESQVINLGFRNVGNLAASNVNATLSCDSPCITITQGTASVGNVNPYDQVSIDNAFAFTVSDDIPDQTAVTFNLVCTDGNETWTSLFDMTVNAPSFDRIATVLEEVDGNGNGRADSGETILLHFTVSNNGHSLAPNTVFSVFCPAPEIVFDQQQILVGDLVSGGSFTTDFTCHIEGNGLPTAYELLLTTHSGNYTSQDSYFINVNSEMEDFETGDFSKYEWLFEGSGTWNIVSSGAYEGTYCARTSPLNDLGQATMSLDYEFTCDNEISFYVKTSTEAGYDFLMFFVDDVRYGRWAGETSWTMARFVIPQGTHRLSWSYIKDGGTIGGEDCVWVDNIVLPPLDVVLDVQESAVSETSLYPNPNRGDFTLVLSHKSHVNVFNLMGQCIYDLNEADGLQQFHLETAGIYLVRVSNEAGIEVKRVVVEITR
jgi:hypothetical protein